LPDSFIYYQPKDIVAGDFYWVEPVTPKENKEEELMLFAAADCTGHGVPGAMMSVVCHNSMNRAIGEFNITEPGAMLDKTREIIVEQLNKTKNIDTASIGSIRDGMDIALCSFNSKRMELKYAGAHNPLWVIKNGTSDIFEIKATKQSVGNVDNPKPYETHTLQLEKGDTIYLFSDGYADQFGGEKGKKLKTKPFKQLLVSFKDKSMDEQHQLLKQFFNNWKNDLEQIDDVCVMGVRI
jgi:serine phosphatase RsbU (regulator of sigma subunit)